VGLPELPVLLDSREGCRSRRYDRDVVVGRRRRGSVSDRMVLRAERREGRKHDNTCRGGYETSRRVTLSPYLGSVSSKSIHFFASKVTLPQCCYNPRCDTPLASVQSSATLTCPSSSSSPTSWIPQKPRQPLQRPTPKAPPPRTRSRFRPRTPSLRYHSSSAPSKAPYP